MVRYPVFRAYTDIERGHVLGRYRWTIVGSPDTRNDKGIEPALGHKVIDGIEMIKGKVHVIHRTSELSFLQTRFRLVINATLDKFNGCFNTPMLIEIIA